MSSMRQCKKRLLSAAMLGLACGLSACEVYLVDPAVPQEPVVVERAPEPVPPPLPLPGSETIVFMDSTTAQLGGCRTISSLRFSHNGPFEDGMVLVRNAAVQINANRMIPIRIAENMNQADGPHIYQVKLLRCPPSKKTGSQIDG